VFFYTNTMAPADQANLVSAILVNNSTITRLAQFLWKTG